MPSLIVDAKPEVLEWARESIGLSREDAATKIGIKDSILRDWEEGFDAQGTKGPSIAQLRRMADVYKQPLAALLLPKPPEAENLLRADFRLLPQNRQRSWSPDLRVALRRVQMQRSVAEDLAELEGETSAPIDLEIRFHQEPEEAGRAIREWLGGIPRREANASYLRQWIELIETKSILVTQVQRVALEEMRGCSISDQPFPAIILNGADSQNGKVFTLMHELVHILLRQGGLCDMEDKFTNRPGNTEALERFCNQVAATTLMPRDDVLERLRPYPRKAVEQDAVITILADGFGVSREAMLLRLVALNWLSWDFYAERKPHFEEVNEERRRERETKKSGGPTYYTMKVRDLGRRYINTVLNAYYRDDITIADLSRYLNIKVERLPTLESTLGAQQ